MVIRGTDDFKNGPLNPLFNVPKLSYLGAVKSKTPYGGQQWVLTYWSFPNSDPTQASPVEEAFALVPPGFSATSNLIGPIYVLTVTTPDIPEGGSIGVHATYYELLGNNIQLDLREHPKALALGHVSIALIDSVLNGDAPEGNLAAGDETELYRLLRQRNGNGYFQKPQFVFRYTRVASDLATLDVGYANIQKILTTAQMVAETGGPTGILAAIGEAVTSSQPTVATSYQYGWLKQTPTVTLMAGNKFQISGEYILEVWSTWIYATV